MLLDVGTHVFNSGTVTFIEKVTYSDKKYFHHGRYHYVRVERGHFAKVWTVVAVDGVPTVVPRVRVNNDANTVSIVMLWLVDVHHYLFYQSLLDKAHTILIIICSSLMPL